MTEHNSAMALDHFHQKWNALDGRAREAASMLGYTPEDWDAGRVTHLFLDKNWADLDAPQKDAAKLLGLTQEKWSQVAFNAQKNHPGGFHEQEKEAKPSGMPSPFDS